eukprot:gene18198-24542_t
MEEPAQEGKSLADNLVISRIGKSAEVSDDDATADAMVAPTPASKSAFHNNPPQWRINSRRRSSDRGGSISPSPLPDNTDTYLDDAVFLRSASGARILHGSSMTSTTSSEETGHYSPVDGRISVTDNLASEFDSGLNML